MAKDSATRIPQEQRSKSQPENQSTEEWLRKLGDLEAQSKGDTKNGSKSSHAIQVNHKQLSARLQENIDHEDLLDLLERGEL